MAGSQINLFCSKAISSWPGPVGHFGNMLSHCFLFIINATAEVSGKPCPWKMINSMKWPHHPCSKACLPIGQTSPPTFQFRSTCSRAFHPWGKPRLCRLTWLTPNEKCPLLWNIKIAMDLTLVPLGFHTMAILFCQRNQIGRTCTFIGKAFFSLPQENHRQRATWRGRRQSEG